MFSQENKNNIIMKFVSLQISCFIIQTKLYSLVGDNKKETKNFTSAVC